MASRLNLMGWMEPLDVLCVWFFLLSSDNPLFPFAVTIIGGIVFLAFAFSALFISPDAGF